MIPGWFFLVLVYVVGAIGWFIVDVRSRLWTWHDSDWFRTQASTALVSALFWPIVLLSFTVVFCFVLPALAFEKVATWLAKLVLRSKS